MIYSFNKRNGGGSGSGSTTDNLMRTSGYTGSELSGNTLIFKNKDGQVRNEISLSGITPDLSNYYTKTEVDGQESAITQSVTNLGTTVGEIATAVSGNTNNISSLQTAVSANTDAIAAANTTIGELATAVSGNTDNISSLQTQVSANTAAIAELSGSTGGGATELEPVNAIPESGEAGTFIAVNKPDEAGWGAYIPQSEVKSRADITYKVEPSENPNPDLSLYPNTFSFDVNVPDSKYDGNYSWGVSSTIEGSVDYQNNITFTNLGNFTQDGNKYVWNVDWYDYDTSEQVYKTLVMKVVVENGRLYICFNLTDGDCPYEIWPGQINITYWQDYGNWEYDPETGEPTAWTESWSEMSDYVYPQSWNIVSPAHIGIYQANSTNTYQEIGVYPDNAKNADKAVKLYNQPTNGIYNRGDLVVSDYNGQLKVYLKTGDGDLDGDRETLAWQGSVDEINYRLNNLKIDTVYSVSATPISVENGAVVAVENSGETSVKQAVGISGYTYVPMVWGEASGAWGVKQDAANGFPFIVTLSDGTNGMMLNLYYNTDDPSNPYWDYSSLQNDGWVVNDTDNLTFTAEDGNGYGFTLNGYSDGSYVYCDFNVPVTEWYGGLAEWKRVPQSVYQTMVASKDVAKIVKMSAADYALITPDANTLYIII